RKVLGVVVSEIRSTIPSALGSYAISSATEDTFIFFADANNDKVADRIRYFYDEASGLLRRGVVYAEGNPPAYDLDSEEISTIVSGVVNGEELPVFQYYNSSSNLMSFPVEVQNIRLVKVNMSITHDPNGNPPQIFTTSSSASLRNIKDNL